MAVFGGSESRHGDAKPLRTLQERGLATFKNVADLESDDGILEPTALIVKLWRGIASELCAGSHDDLVHVGIHHEVGVVGDDDYLTALASISEERNQF